MSVVPGSDLDRLLAAERAADEAVARAREEAEGLLDRARRTAAMVDADDGQIERRKDLLAAEIDAATRRALDDEAERAQADLDRIEALAPRLDELAEWLARAVLTRTVQETVQEASS